MNLCVYTCFVYLQPFCVTLDFKLFINSIHILFLLYLLLWFWDFTIKNLQDFIKIYRALIKDILLLLWFYFLTVSEFSCLNLLARPYPVSGLTPMPQIPNQLYFVQRSAHEVLGAIWEA